MNVRAIATGLTLTLFACAAENEESDVGEADAYFVAETAQHELALLAGRGNVTSSDTDVSLVVRVTHDFSRATYRDANERGSNWSPVRLRRVGSDLVFGTTHHGETFDFRVSASQVSLGGGPILSVTLTSSDPNYGRPGDVLYAQNREVESLFSGGDAEAVFKRLRRGSSTSARLDAVDPTQFACTHQPRGFAGIGDTGAGTGVVGGGGPSWECRVSTPARYVGRSTGYDVYQYAWGPAESAGMYATFRREGMRNGAGYGFRTSDVSFRCLAADSCMTTLAFARP